MTKTKLETVVEKIMSTCTTTVLNAEVYGNASRNPMTNTLTQPLDNTFARSSALENMSLDTVSQSMKIREGKQRTGGGSIENLDMGKREPDASSLTLSEFENNYDETENEDGISENVGDINVDAVRTGNVEYSAGKALRVGVGSVWHIADQFVRGLTGFSLMALLIGAGILAIAAFYLKHHFMNPMSNMDNGDMEAVIKSLEELAKQ